MSIVATALIILSSVVGMYWAAGIIAEDMRSHLNRLAKRRQRTGGPVQTRRHVFLYPDERVIPIPQVGGQREPHVPARCSHWPRDTVRLSDGTTVAYICRRCDHDWADENWVTAR